MKKKGFTLIELLAVIVILAVIALIIVPIVSNVVDSSRKAAFRESVNGIIDSTNNYLSEYVLMHNDELKEFPVVFTCDGITCSNGEYQLTFKGTVPKDGSVIIYEDGILSSYITDGKYCAYGYKWDMQIGHGCGDVDMTKPTIEGTLDGKVLKLTMHDDGSGIYGYCVTKDDNCNYIKSGEYVEHTLDSMGLYKVSAKDNRGNISEVIEFNVDDIFEPSTPTSGSIGDVAGSNATGTIAVAATGSTDDSGNVTYKYLVTNDSTVPDKNDERFGTEMSFARSCGTSYYAWAIAEDAEGNRSNVYSMGSTSDGANSYSGWTTCSKTCGGGTQTRTNTCALITTGLSQSCNTQSCCSYKANQVVGTYNYTGGVQSFTVPSGCAGTYKLEVWGAQGGEQSGACSNTAALAGKGGYARGNASLTSGQTIYIVVGGSGGTSGAWQAPTSGGYNGGSNGTSSGNSCVNGGWYKTGNGGATSISKVSGLTSSVANSNRYVVANGGGGSSVYLSWCQDGDSYEECHTVTSGSAGGGSTYNVTSPATSSGQKTGHGQAKITFISAN